jgi:glutamine synthetase
VFDDVRFTVEMNKVSYQFDSAEGMYNSDTEYEMGNLGHRPRVKGGYFPVPPVDSAQDLRGEMLATMAEMGLDVEKHHHEVATSQHELGMKFGPLTKMADQMQIYKYVVHQVAAAYGKTATFMPKPMYGDNGSGMHVHQSIWKAGKPLFAGDRYGGFSQLGLWYIGGILKHSRAIAAFSNPTTNSYKRLVPGFEAPVNLAYSSRNRSASCRIPMYSPSPKAKRVEVRYPDPSCNPYLTFAAMLMAGIDGIENKIDPGEPLDRDIYAMTPQEAKGIPQMPGSLDEALRELEADHEFLLRGDVFTEDALEYWIKYKRASEVDPVRLRPHPHEFELYFDI